MRPRKRKGICIVLPGTCDYVELDARDESFGNPFAWLEVEFPFRAFPGPAVWGLDIFEEARAVGPVAGDAGRREGGVREGSEQVGFPFGGGGVEGSVLEFEDLDFPLLRSRVECYGAKGGK